MGIDTRARNTVTASLTNLHYRLMGNSRYWYLPELKKADSFICIIASGLRARKSNLRQLWNIFEFRYVATIARAAMNYVDNVYLIEYNNNNRREDY
jgi:hypothetical protein